MGAPLQINTGLATSAVSVTCLVTYGTMPGNFIFISVYFVLSKRERCIGLPLGSSTKRAQPQCMLIPSWQLSIRGWYSRDEEPTTLMRRFRPSSWLTPTQFLRCPSAYRTRLTALGGRLVFGLFTIACQPAYRWYADFRQSELSADQYLSSTQSGHGRNLEVGIHKEVRIQEDTVSRPSLDSFLAYYQRS